MSSNDPDQIRADIERTREHLSADVNTLTDEVRPSTVAKRQLDKVKGAASGLTEQVMGKAASAGDSASHAGNSLSAAPGVALDRAKGNPLVVGAIAFGLGVLIAGLIPTSQKEQDAAAAIKDKAQPLAQDLAASAKDAASNLQGAAQEAAESLKDSASDAVQTVKEEGSSVAQDVKTDAGAAKDSIQNTATS
jgi:hypothetical protein